MVSRATAMKPAFLSTCMLGMIFGMACSTPKEPSLRSSRESQFAASVDRNWMIDDFDVDSATFHLTIDEQISLFDERIRQSPRDSNLYNLRGSLKLSKGDHAGAMSDCSQAIAVDPTNPLAFNNRALVRRLLGDAVGAAEDINRYRRLSSKK